MRVFNFRFFGIPKICFSKTGSTGAHVPKVPFIPLNFYNTPALLNETKIKKHITDIYLFKKPIMW
jgi:hypothetical protein